MNKITSLPKPVQAGDYGKIIPQTPTNSDKAESANTDGRKTLALWSR
jgi:hypothetical protein